VTTERNPTITNPAIPPGSTILIPGANGLLSTHIIEQSLLSGFKVRGTVRDSKRCAWVAEYFSGHFGPEVFELFEVVDVYKKGYLDDAVKGCSAVIHTVPTHVDFNAPDPIPPTENEIATVRYALEAASKEPTVKRFVLTSSAWTAGVHPANTKYKYDQNSWNEECIKKTYENDPEPADGLEMFMAIKTRTSKRSGSG
jgi:nucleoside-diphosphate-sugar epimerase